MRRHYDINPNAIRVGDIVEAQISFEGIRLKGNRCKMAIILRAITVVDKGAYNVSMYVWPAVAPTNGFKRTQSMREPKRELMNSNDQQLWKEKSDITMKMMMRRRTCPMPLGWRWMNGHDWYLFILFTWIVHVITFSINIAFNCQPNTQRILKL